MNAEASLFMLKEIDARIAKRRRPVPTFVTSQIEQIRFKAVRGYDLDVRETVFLKDQYERMTDPSRIKW